MQLSDALFNAEKRDSYITDEMAAQKVPGVSMTAVKNGKIAGTWCYGISDGTTKEAITPDTVFEAASLTKTLFGCLVLRLVDEGKLGLDQPIAPLAPQLKLSNDPRIEEITPRMALSHSTGLPNWASKPLTFAFDPGTDFSYSGEGYYFLQKCIEEITGKDLPTLFEEYFFTPWGMKASSGVWHEGLNMSAGFNTAGIMSKRRTAVDDTGNAPEPNSAWSLYTTSPEYAAYVTNLIGNRAGLSESSFTEMSSPQNQADESIEWGLGWGLIKDAPGVLWHWGDNTGFKSLIVWDKNSGDGLAIFTNSDNGTKFTLDVAAHFTGASYFNAIGKFVSSAE